MPTTGPRELMILVERVVRPLPIPMARRMRARKELLAHLQTIYDVELARDSDANAALTRVRERFGDPQMLTEEFRATIPTWELWLARYQPLVVQEPGLSTGWYALRMTFCVGMLMAFLLSCLLAIRQVVGEPTFEAEIRLFIALVIGQSLWLGGFLYLSLQAGAAWDHAPRRWMAVLGYAISLFVLPILSWGALIAFVTGSLTGNTASPTGLLIAGTLTMLTGVVVGVLHHREQASYLPWSELTLDPA